MSKVKIYIGHSSSFNYHDKIYKPIRKNIISDNFNIILPHENSDEVVNSKDEIFSSNLFIAELSNPSLGLGIEMGWADLYGIKIIGLYERGHNISSSCYLLTDDIFEYSNEEEFISIINKTIYELL